MRKVIYTLVIMFTCFISSKSYADNIIIGFRGMHGIFDTQAFYQYARKRNLTPVVLNASDKQKALQLIQANPNYELYGYSLGAITTMSVVKEIHNRGLTKPKYVVTLGAYHSVNVDFRPFGIPFKNYFDASGVGQRSPGTFLKNVNHFTLQKYVNTLE